uniref:Post-SET domain-containing protein n=1 Tax=Periophthalmus magnuspinnatus TaxID=409849 RepID=A0A3B4A3F7_9GOBI
MVIEYTGTVLRNEVAIRKEKTYRSRVKCLFHYMGNDLQGTGHFQHASVISYIFQIIYVVTFERGFKIIISSICRIGKGEELCFDYQLDSVEGQHTIACHCGASECRKWIN